MKIKGMKSVEGNQRLEGSFTVEASFVVPFITFIIAGIIYMIAFSHDRVLMQTYSYRAGEYQLSQEYARRYESGSYSCNYTESDVRKSMKTTMIMMKPAAFSIKKDGLSFRGLYHSYKSYRTVEACSGAQMEVNDKLVSSFTGNRIKAAKKAESVIVDYTDDWFKMNLKGDQ